MPPIGRSVTVLCVLAVLGMAKNEVPVWKMNNGREIPALALGTYLGYDENGIMQSVNKQLRDVVQRAVVVGYRHIDTAAVYQTEDEIGEAIANSLFNGTIRRDDLFITTKLWNNRHKRSQVMEALTDSLKKLRSNYVDLYLMHWPIALNDDYSLSTTDFMETWKGMEDALKLGKARSIGVSNFNKPQLERLLQECTMRPQVLQIEAHPQLVQDELVKYAQTNGLVVMGYSPFGSLVPRLGMEKGGLSIDEPTLKEIAKKYKKTTPQILLRWLIDRNIIPIPKTVKTKRLVENISIFDFKLTGEEVAKISAFNANKRFTLPSFWQNHPHYPFEKISNPIGDPFKKKK